MLNITDRLLRNNDTDTLFTASKTPATRRAEAILAAWRKRLNTDGRFSEEIDLTPELAELLLLLNACNRALHEKTISDMERDIREGNFCCNGETIILSDNLELNDGQHRCHAVIRSGRSIKTFVVVGVERTSRMTVDSNQTTRTPGDFMSMEGVAKGNNFAAVAVLLMHIDKHGYIPKGYQSPAMRPTKQQIREFGIKHRGKIEAALEDLPSTGTHKIASYSTIVVAYMLIASVCDDKETALSFIKRLISGDAPVNSPIWVTRERMLEEKRKRRTPHSGFQIEMILRGWNAFRTNRKLSRIQIMDQWPTIED